MKIVRKYFDQVEVFSLSPFCSFGSSFAEDIFISTLAWTVKWDR